MLENTFLVGKYAPSGSHRTLNDEDFPPGSTLFEKNVLDFQQFFSRFDKKNKKPTTKRRRIGFIRVDCIVHYY